MHVRGVLSHPKVLAALRPFVVSFWGQANDEPIPSDLRPLYQASRDGGSNVRCFVLDSAGRLLHSFNGFPGNAGNPLDYSLDEYADYLVGQIVGAGAAKDVPTPTDEAELRLPEPKDGVRLYISLPGRRDSYGAPVVAAVENQDEWTVLAQPKVARAVEARSLARWLRLCYPAGVNEQLEPFKVVRGTLELKPLGADRALLSGTIRMAMSDTDYETFNGKCEAVVTYGAATTIRGIVDGTYWRFDRPHDRWTQWKLTTAIESRPR